MFSSTLYRERKVLLAPKVGMVQMAFLESKEMMEPLETKDLKDHLVKKVVLQLSKIAFDVHHIVLPKASKAAPVRKENLAKLVSLANQVLLVNLEGAFLVFLENLEKMVNQVVMESMVNLVSQVNLEDLEMLLAFESLPVQILSLA